MEPSKALKENKGVKPGQIIRIEQDQLTRHLDKVVRGTVSNLKKKVYARIEQWLNASIEVTYILSKPSNDSGLMLWRVQD